MQPLFGARQVVSSAAEALEKLHNLALLSHIAIVVARWAKEHVVARLLEPDRAQDNLRARDDGASAWGREECGLEELSSTHLLSSRLFIAFLSRGCHLRQGTSAMSAIRRVQACMRGQV